MDAFEVVLNDLDARTSVDVLNADEFFNLKKRKKKGLFP